MTPSERRESAPRSPVDDLGGAAASATEPADAAEPGGIRIGCSLTAADVQTRVEEWHALARRVRERQPIIGGLRLIFESTTPQSVIADLAAREHACWTTERRTAHSGNTDEKIGELVLAVRRYVRAR